MKKFFLLYTILITFSISAQIPPSPGSMGLVREASVPVNLYTGIPQINVPLYTLPHHNGHNIPVSLSYHAGGHKVQDVAGPVGLGWTLHAGGMITRVVRGLPDAGLGPLDPTTAQDYQDISEGDRDGEFDLFYLSLPGRSVKFIYDEVNNTGGYTIPKSNLDIQFEWEYYTGGGGSRVWTVTDEQGNKYFFGNHTANDNAEELTTSNTMENGSYIISNDRTYTSTWYLVKIDYYNSAYDVTFSYVAGNTYDYEYFNNIMEVNWEMSVGGGASNTVAVDDYEVTEANTKITIDPIYISSISSLKGTIKFGWTTGKTDIGDRRLTSVTLYRPGETQSIDNYTLSQSYFDSYLAPRLQHSANDDFVYSYGTSSLNTPDIDRKPENRYRLRLNSIEKNGFQYRSFEYYGDDAGDNRVNSNGEPFKYNILPPRDGESYDFLGYANTGYSHVIPSAPIMEHRFKTTTHVGSFSTTYRRFISGSSDQPSIETSRANVLNRINFPSGGYQELNFEQNMQGASPVPGIRIKSIVINDGFKDVSEVTYSYSDPNVYEKASYMMSFWQNGGDVFITDEVSRVDNAITIVNSNSNTQLFDLNGSYITYGKVIEEREGFGKIEYTYFDSEDFGDVDPEYDVEGIDIDIHAYNGPPFAPNTSLAWTRGMLKSKTNFVLEDGVYKKLSDQTYHYYSVDDFQPVFEWRNTKVYYLVRFKELNPITAIWNKLTSWFSTPSLPNREDVHIVGRYNTIYEPLIPKSIISRVFDKNDETKFIETIDEFSYDGSNEIIASSTTQTNADGSQNKVEITNVVDIAPTSQPSNPSSEVEALWRMREDNLLGYPIETLNLFKGPSSSTWSVLSGQYTEYDKYITPSIVLPYQTFSFTASSPIDVNSFYKAIELGGNLIKDTRYEPSAVFSYNDKGERSRSVDVISGQTTDYEYDIRGHLNKVEYDPLNDPNRKTTYTTKDLVGIESETDMNNKPVSYEYDSRNRLHLIRDEDNNIVERYRYNYANEENITFGIGIQDVDCLTKNESATFYMLNREEAYGPSSCTWNIGGRIIENDGTAFQHTFLRSGTHGVSLEINNPEYHGTRSYNKTITVYEESNPTICSPPSYDVCTNYQGYDPNECTPQTNSLEAKIVTVINGMNNAEAVDYHWEWRANIQSSGWSTFGDSSPVSELQESLFVGPISFVRIRCTVSYCGIEEVLETTVSIINANGNCP